jgi:hypothetical protein
MIARGERCRFIALQNVVSRVTVRPPEERNVGEVRPACRGEVRPPFVGDARRGGEVEASTRNGFIISLEGSRLLYEGPWEI